MRSRDFINLVAAVALVWPRVAAGQTSSMPVIALLDAQSYDPNDPRLVKFREGLSGEGYLEGKNIVIQYRWGNNDVSTLPAIAADLAQRRVAAIVTVGGFAAAKAARAATSTIPIVFVTGLDPAQNGFVASLNRPGGNATGVVSFAAELMLKRKELLLEWVGRGTKTAYFMNADKRGLNDGAKKQVDDESNLARKNFDIFLDIAEKCQSVDKSQSAQSAACFGEQIAASFAAAAKQGVGALVVGSDPFFTNRHEQLVALAAKYSLAAGYQQREFVDAGGLMSYGPNGPDLLRQAGVYTGRILKGANPAEMPILTPEKVDLVINLRTARTLGLGVLPPGLRVSANEILN
jgi:putative tryptophan/tyrosine transport system substrate-binding protein